MTTPAPQIPTSTGPILNHTMMRIRDPAKSRHFYETILGMTHITQFDFEAGKFSLHFFAFNVPEEIKSAEKGVRDAYAFSVPGVLELTHNWGTESDPNFSGYSSGNSDPGRGYGHIGISVDDVESFCAKLEADGVTFKKKLTDGSMKHIAFVLDPDGYWVEILPKGLKI
ncbi:Lactoylglutathione lyase [Chytridiales sp. JEL 0842]|nr:Lactoylglutathione lyase [Chytridiales sp. JEL 0842]